MLATSVAGITLYSSVRIKKIRAAYKKMPGMANHPGIFIIAVIV
jgi:hypothetical protein